MVAARSRSAATSRHRSARSARSARDLREAFGDFQGPYVSIDVLLGWGTTRFAAVPVRHDARAAGTSNYGFVRLATHALNVLTGFTTRPLRIATLIGVAFTFFGFALLVFVLVRYFVEGSPVPGFPFLASLIAIFSGAQLLTLGIIGEYLARMHVRVMDRPPYAVHEEVGGEPDASEDEELLRPVVAGRWQRAARRLNSRVRVGDVHGDLGPRGEQRLQQRVARSTSSRSR